MKGAFATLIRREFWQNKSLWIAPLVAAVLYPCVEVFLSSTGDDFYVRSVDKTQVSWLLRETSFHSAAALIGLVTGLVLFAYLLECLNAERRDRSILFWKSLPVSDAQTVLAKLVTAMVVVWLGVIPLIFLTQPIIMLINWVRYESLRPYINIEMLAAWPAMRAHIGLTWAHYVLWFAPVAAWLMLDSSHITEFVGGWLLPWLPRFSPPPAAMGSLIEGTSVSGARVYHQMPIDDRWWVPFEDPALWIGLAVAAGMLYIVIRLRQFRDDT